MGCVVWGGPCASWGAAGWGLGRAAMQGGWTPPMCDMAQPRLCEMGEELCTRVCGFGGVSALGGHVCGGVWRGCAPQLHLFGGCCALRQRPPDPESGGVGWAVQRWLGWLEAQCHGGYGV